MTLSSTIYLPDVVGKGYRDYWHFKGRYRVCKGSRASKKSKTTALNFIARTMQYPLANSLVIRKTYRTLKDSCFAELKWAVNRLGVAHLWDVKESPLEMTYCPTGQKILFRGLDDPLKVTSVTVEVGMLCWLWIEEAYEVESESDFDMINESIRGKAPEGLFKQITLTFNPWNENHWLKSRFFDIDPDPDVLAMTTNYTCNEWLDGSDIRMFEQMRINNPRRYAVAGLGEWGVAEGLVYERWRVEPFDRKSIGIKYAEGGVVDESYKYRHVFGLDYGYTNDPTAFIAMAVCPPDHKIYIYDELYETRLLNSDIVSRIVSMGYRKERIVADSAEPKTNDTLRREGLRIVDSVKGADSIRAGVQQLQEYELIVHPSCKNVIVELSAYSWQTDKSGRATGHPQDSDNHLMDAMRYAMQDIRLFKGEAPPRKRSNQSLVTTDDFKGGWT